MLLQEYKFKVFTTASCPKNHIEWKIRSNILNCTNRNGYMCLPNENITSLIEFCYSLYRVPIPKGKEHIRVLKKTIKINVQTVNITYIMYMTLIIT